MNRKTTLNSKNPRATARLHPPGGEPFPVEVADTFIPRFWGLMGRKEAGYGLYLSPCDAIHMLFMRFAIDAVFVDREGMIVSIRKAVRPWGFAMGGRKAHAVLELPASRGFGEILAVGMLLPLVLPEKPPEASCGS